MTGDKRDQVKSFLHEEGIALVENINVHGIWMLNIEIVILFLKKKIYKF